MNLLVLNPNTSDLMTEDIRRTVYAVKSNDTKVDVLHPDFGPETLESFYDYHLAVFGMIRHLHNTPKQYDGILVACFGDPGLYAIKEICSCPVIGIAEASLSAANLLGHKFSVIASSEKAGPMMASMVNAYGMNDRCAGIYTLNVSVADAEKNKEQTIAAIIAAGKKAKENGAEVLIPGCAGMTGISKAIEEALQMPVLDPVAAGFGMLEMIAKQNLFVSRAGLFCHPAPKQIAREDLLK